MAGGSDCRSQIGFHPAPSGVYRLRLYGICAQPDRRHANSLIHRGECLGGLVGAGGLCHGGDGGDRTLIATGRNP